MNIERLQRMRSQHLALKCVTVPVLLAVQRQHLCIADPNAFGSVRGNGKHPRFEDVAAGPFEQTGIAFLPEDRLEDFARPLLLDYVGLDVLVTDPHAKPRDRGIGRQREMEDSLQLSRRVIHKRLLDHGARNLIANVHGDPMVADRQRRIATVDPGHQRSHGLAG